MVQLKINTVFNPIHLVLTNQNLEAFVQGQPLPNTTGPSETSWQVVEVVHYLLYS